MNFATVEFNMYKTENLGLGLHFQVVACNVMSSRTRIRSNKKAKDNKMAMWRVITFSSCGM